MPFLRSLRVVLEMIKLEHTLFALPFAFLGMLLAAQGWPGFGGDGQHSGKVRRQPLTQGVAGHVVPERVQRDEHDVVRADQGVRVEHGGQPPAARCASTARNSAP